MGPADVGLIFSLSQTDHTDMAASTPIGTPPGFDFSAVTRAISPLLEKIGNVNGSLGQLAAVAEGAGKKISPVQLVLEAVGDISNRVHNGARENVAYTYAKEMSGNPLGLTNDQIQERVAAISKASGITEARAAAAMAALIATGKVLDGRALDLAVVAVAERERVLKIPAADTAAKFAMLGSDPVKASIELNKSDEFSNYLKPQTLRQIVSLDDQGKATDAVALAQTALAEQLKLRTRNMAASRTVVDRFDQTLSDAGDRIDDYVRSFGRPTTKQQQIDDRARVIDHYRKQQSGQSNPLFDNSKQLTTRLTAETANLEEGRRRDLQLAATQQNEASASRAEAAAIEKTRNDSSRDKDNQSIAAAVAKQWEAGGFVRSPASPAANQGSSSPRKPSSIGIQRAEVDGLRPCIEVVCGCKAGAPDQAKQGVRKGEASEAARPQATAGEAAERASVDPEQARQAALLESMRKATSGVLEQTTALDAQNTAHGKTKSALKELNIAQLERQYQDLDNTEQVIPGYLEALGARIEAEKELLKVTRSSEGIETADKEKTKREAKANKMSEDIGGAFREGFVNLLEGKENALDKMGESLKKKIVSSVADALYDASLKPAVEAFSGWFSGLFKGSTSGAGAAAGGSSGGSWIGSAVSTVLGFFGVKSANGNVFASPGLHAYANSVVGTPTFFPFANGIGLMGEAGPEAIMPLRRGSDGRLGVSAQGSDGGGGSSGLHYAPTNVFNIDSRSDRGAVLADLDRALQANNKGQMEQLKRLRVVPQ